MTKHSVWLLGVLACGRAGSAPDAPAAVELDAVDSCAAITCSEPPAAECTDSITLRTYAAAGTCAAGACSYAPTDTPCAAPAHASPTCAAAVCDFACDAGYERAGDACTPTFVIPPASIGAIELQGTCTFEGHGWQLGQQDECEPYTRMGTQPATRAVTIAQLAGGYTLTTTLRVDSLTGLPDDPYSVDISEAQPVVTYGDGQACDPIYGTCVDHTWTLGPHSLVLVTASLHDNSSSTPLDLCFEYYYARLDCTYTLTW